MLVMPISIESVLGKVITYNDKNYVITKFDCASGFKPGDLCLRITPIECSIAAFDTLRSVPITEIVKEEEVPDVN